MSDVEWPIVAEIFADTLDVPPDEREAAIAERCAGRGFRGPVPDDVAGPTGSVRD